MIKMIDKMDLIDQLTEMEQLTANSGDADSAAIIAGCILLIKNMPEIDTSKLIDRGKAIEAVREVIKSEATKYWQPTYSGEGFSATINAIQYAACDALAKMEPGKSDGGE